MFVHCKVVVFEKGFRQSHGTNEEQATKEGLVIKSIAARCLQRRTPFAVVFSYRNLDSVSKVSVV
jgi:hypothetical protein